MKKYLFIIVAVLPLFCFSCKHNTQEQKEEGELLTSKILYDVPIVNLQIGEDRTRNNPDWFWQNIPSPECEKFVADLFNNALNGKTQIYEYDMFGTYDTLVPISKKEAKDLLTDRYFEVEIPDIYVEEIGEYIPAHHDSVKLDEKIIRKLRFLEEWRIVDGKICKKVLAVAPVFTIRIPNLNPPEFDQVLFWMEPDEKLLK